MTGAELRAWRERLGKDEAWVEEILDNTAAGRWSTGLGSRSTNGEFRRRVCEAGVASPYSDGEVGIYVTAYRAALEAEEARQAAERGPVEPVCPEGVTAWVSSTKGVMISMSPDQSALVHVLENGSIAPLWTYGRENLSPALLEYTAVLSRHRAALHAASDKQRKLDAVRAAEETYEKACVARDAAGEAVTRAYADRASARREAGL